MKNVALIAVRLSSSRLPRKAVKPILGRPMIARMVERVQAAPSIDEIVIATSTHEEDDDLERLTRELGIGCYRGSLDDVLGRIHAAAEASGADRVIELLGDNPLGLDRGRDPVLRGQRLRVCR